MAIKTNVDMRYRTPYIPGKKVPHDTLIIMKHEISLMRKDLISKQEALQRSTKFKSDDKLYSYLKNLKVKDITSVKKIQNEWERLRSLELSNRTSVTGKRKLLEEEVENFQNAGYEGVSKKNINQLNKILDEFDDSEYSKLYKYELVVQVFIESKNKNITLKELVNKLA